MNRRQFSSAASSALGLATMAAWRQAHALGLGDLTHTEASQGLKAALERGALAAVGLLGKPGGFLDNPKVRIPLPGFLADAGKFLRAMGRGQQVDELEVAMNRAAEAAVPLAQELLTNAVKSMTVNDAKNILAGGDTSVTDFFAEKTRTPLAATVPARRDPRNGKGRAGGKVQPRGRQGGRHGPRQARTTRRSSPT